MEQEQKPQLEKSESLSNVVRRPSKGKNKGEKVKIFSSLKKGITSIGSDIKSVFKTNKLSPYEQMQQQQRQQHQMHQQREQLKQQQQQQFQQQGNVQNVSPSSHKQSLSVDRLDMQERHFENTSKVDLPPPSAHARIVVGVDEGGRQVLVDPNEQQQHSRVPSVGSSPSPYLSSSVGHHEMAGHRSFLLDREDSESESGGLNASMSYADDQYDDDDASVDSACNDPCCTQCGFNAGALSSRQGPQALDDFEDLDSPTMLASIVFFFSYLVLYVVSHGHLLFSVLIPLGGYYCTVLGSKWLEITPLLRFFEIGSEYAFVEKRNENNNDIKTSGKAKDKDKGAQRKTSESTGGEVGERDPAVVAALAEEARLAKEKEERERLIREEDDRLLRAAVERAQEQMRIDMEEEEARQQELQKEQRKRLAAEKLSKVKSPGGVFGVSNGSKDKKLEKDNSQRRLEHANSQASLVGDKQQQQQHIPVGIVFDGGNNSQHGGTSVYLPNTVTGSIPMGVPVNFSTDRGVKAASSPAKGIPMGIPVELASSGSPPLAATAGDVLATSKNLAAEEKSAAEEEQRLKQETEEREVEEREAEEEMLAEQAEFASKELVNDVNAGAKANLEAEAMANVEEAAVVEERHEEDEAVAPGESSSSDAPVAEEEEVVSVEQAVDTNNNNGSSSEVVTDVMGTDEYDDLMMMGESRGRSNARNIGNNTSERR